MVAEENLSIINSWVPSYEELTTSKSQEYGIPELFSEGVLLSEAILTKLFSGGTNISDYFARLMHYEPTNIYEMIFVSWVLKYLNKEWEFEYKKRIDKKIHEYVKSKGLPGRFSRLTPLYAMYLSFAYPKELADFEIVKEPSFLSNYLIYSLNVGKGIDRKSLSALKKFQNKNGGFPSSRLTMRKQNIYGTALALIPLIVDDVNSHSTKQAINYLMSNKPPYSFTEDGEPLLYVNMFAAYSIRLYSYFKELYNDPIIKLAIKNSNKNVVNLILYKQFSDYISKSFELNKTEFTLMNSFGTKVEVRERRQDIFNLLSEKGGLDPARIIDLLKKRYPERYKHIKKRSHITMFKLDLEYLRHLGLLSEVNSKYFII